MTTLPTSFIAFTRRLSSQLQELNRQHTAETYASAANSLERFLHGHDLPLSHITSSLL